MNEGWSQGQVIAALLGAGLLLLLDLALSIALSGVSVLSRASLHRLAGESEARLGFLAGMPLARSRHRSSAILLRRLGLIGAIVLIVLAGRGAGWSDVLVIATAGSTLIGIILLQEIATRSLTLWSPRRALRASAFVVRFSRALLYPVVEPLHALFERIERARTRREEQAGVEEEGEVEALIEVGEREGLLEAEESEMMRGIVDLDDTPVRELMTPRTDIVALPVETSVAEARRTVLEAGHSRLPVYSGTIDNVVGILHVRDLVRAWEERQEQQSISRYVRPAIFVPETRTAAELLADMRRKMPLALVVDEYGGVAGLVTLEDVLEEIVGEIQDEHDVDEELMKQDSDGSWIINAVAHVEELEQLFDVELEERDFDTVAGFVVSGFGRVPRNGESLDIQGLHVEVLQADHRRVQKVRIRPLGLAGEARANP